MDDNRKRLKIHLCNTRVILTDVGFKPVCAWCGEPIIMMQPDLHEVLITRGDVQGCSYEVQQMIMVVTNCVNVHPGACHFMAATEEGQERCIKHLLKYEGQAVLIYLNDMVPFFKSKVMIGEAISKVKKVMEDLKHENKTV